MEHRQTLDSSMSSLYSASSSNRQQQQQQLQPLQAPSQSQSQSQSQLDAFNYSATMSSSSPTPSQATTSTGSLRATTIGTVVVRCGPIQLVIALLQVSSPPPAYPTSSLACCSCQRDTTNLDMAKRGRESERDTRR